MPEHFGIKNPTSLTLASDGAGMLVLEARDAAGRRLTILADRVDWMHAFNGGASRGMVDTARAAFERGDIDVAEFERLLDRELGLER